VIDAPSRSISASPRTRGAVDRRSRACLFVPVEALTLSPGSPGRCPSVASTSAEHPEAGAPPPSFPRRNRPVRPDPSTCSQVHSPPAARRPGKGSPLGFAEGTEVDYHSVSASISTAPQIHRRRPARTRPRSPILPRWVTQRGLPPAPAAFLPIRSPRHRARLLVKPVCEMMRIPYSLRPTPWRLVVS